MPYVVANGPDAANVDLSEPDAGDYLALGYRSTGVVSGGAITASSAMTLNVAAVDCVISGVPYKFTGTTAVLGSANSNPRYDLIGWTSAGRTIIAGTPSSNPTFPTFDPAVFCLGAAVYVGANVGSITAPLIQDKRIQMHSTIRRNYAADTDPIIEAATPSKPTSFKLWASGFMSWVNSTLTRTADAALELASSFTVRQLTANLAGLIVKAAAGATANPFEVRSDTDVLLASIGPDGKFISTNVTSGTTGDPNGNRTAAPGTIYVCTVATNGNLAVWYKLTGTGNTGWISLRMYDPTAQLFPTGTVLPWLGSTSDTPPAGFVLGDGQPVLIDTSTNALYSLVGSRFGTAAAGYFYASPDLRGQTLFGAGSVLALDSGAQVGAGSVVLSEDQMPAHIHELVDPGHIHPRQGEYWYAKNAAYSGDLHADYEPTSGTPLMLVEEDSFNRSAKTGVTMLPAGGTDPVSLYQPSTSVLYLIKL